MNWKKYLDRVKSTATVITFVSSVIAIIFTWCTYELTDDYSYENAKPVINFSNVSVDIVKVKNIMAKTEKAKVCFKIDVENLGALTAERVTLSYVIYTGIESNSLVRFDDVLNLGDLYTNKIVNLEEDYYIDSEIGAELPEITSKSIDLTLRYVDKRNKELEYTETYVYNPKSNKFEIDYDVSGLFDFTLNSKHKENIQSIHGIGKAKHPINPKFCD